MFNRSSFVEFIQAFDYMRLICDSKTLILLLPLHRLSYKYNLSYNTECDDLTVMDYHNGSVSNVWMLGCPLEGLNMKGYFL